MISDSKYQVSIDSKHEINPEDILVDAKRKHESLEMPIQKNVFTLILFMVVVLLGAFALKAFQLQIVNGSSLAIQADITRFKQFPIPSIRGNILDRNMLELVINEPVLHLVIYTAEFPTVLSEREKSMTRLAELLEVPIDKLESEINANADRAAFELTNDIPKETALVIQYSNLPGIYIVPGVKRKHLFDSDFAHVIGYTSKVTYEDIAQDDYLIVTDRIGRFGVEASYEKELRGKHIKVPLERESLSGTDIYEGGNNLVLSLDLYSQQELNKILTRVVKLNGVTKGTAIVQKIDTGEILAMVSYPTFDPNIFETSDSGSSVSKIKSVLNNQYRPLFNRAISGLFAPGSTIKPLIGMAGLQEGIITPLTIITSLGFISVESDVNPGKFFVYRDWKAHGATNLRKAIADSVDVYFYTLGGGYGEIKGLGVDRISSYLNQLGAGRVLGIDLPGEASGVVPDRAWKREHRNDSWYVGDTYNISIGQGDLLVTPLWLNSYVAAIASGGTIYKPYVVQKEIDTEGIIVFEASPEIVAEMPFDEDIIKTMQRAMRSTVTDGTAVLLNSLPVSTAAKTGTAQIGGDQVNSLISVWAPYEDPEIAITIVLEETQNKYGLVHEIARDFLMWYYSSSTSN